VIFQTMNYHFLNRNFALTVNFNKLLPVTKNHDTLVRFSICQKSSWKMCFCFLITCLYNNYYCLPRQSYLRYFTSHIMKSLSKYACSDWSRGMFAWEYVSFFYKSNRKLFACVCIAWYEHLRGEFSTVMTSSRVCQPLSCLFQALQTQKTFSIA